MDRWATLLLIVVFLPLAGAALVPLLSSASLRAARWVALAFSLATLALVAVIVYQFDPAERRFAASDVAWLGNVAGSVDVRLSFGLDGLSLWLFALSALLVVVSILVSWQAIDEGVGGFYGLILLLESGMLGVFAARDIVLFYVFFEFTLIPLFFLIGVWGSADRRRAAIKFFVFTLAGSLFVLIGLVSLALVHEARTGTLSFSMSTLARAYSYRPLEPGTQMWIFLALFAGFAIKVPLFPLHTWLPLAHTEAPTAGSVLLAGVLLKIGGYGFLRFSLPMLPDATAAAAPWLLGLSVVGIVYGALVALAQDDIKRMIAYSSVSHLGFCMLGVFALNRLGAEGGTLQMVNHGLSTGGLFAVVGMLYERYHTRRIDDYSGMAKRLPWLAFFMVVFTFSSIGLPGLNGFAGEVLVLVGMFQRAWSDPPAQWSLALRIMSVLAVSGVVLGAWYMLVLLQRVFFGPLREPSVAAHDHTDGHSRPVVRDLSWREIICLTPLVVMIVWIGLVPQHFLAPMAATVDRLAARPAAIMEQRPYAAFEGRRPRGPRDRSRAPRQVDSSSGQPVPNAAGRPLSLP